MAVNLDQAVEGYIRLRDRKDAIKKQRDAEMKVLDEKMDRIEGAILAHFDTSGQTSAKTPHGTPYISEVNRYKTADRGALIEFVKDNDAFHFFTNSVAKKAVDEWREENGDELPPGISVDTERTINIRRPTS